MGPLDCAKGLQHLQPGTFTTTHSASLHSMPPGGRLHRETSTSLRRPTVCSRCDALPETAGSLFALLFSLPQHTSPCHCSPSLHGASVEAPCLAPSSVTPKSVSPTFRIIWARTSCGKATRPLTHCHMLAKLSHSHALGTWRLRGGAMSGHFHDRADIRITHTADTVGYDFLTQGGATLDTSTRKVHANVPRLARIGSGLLQPCATTTRPQPCRTPLTTP